MTTSRQNRISTYALVVEDNPVDVHLLQLALREERSWPIEMIVAEDGEKAIHLLSSTEMQSFERSPDFIVLDLNIPKRDGTEVLHVIRNMQPLAQLPVAILSSSPCDVIENKLNAANVKADGYFTKPSNIEEFLKLGKVLRDWYETRRTGVGRL